MTIKEKIKGLKQSRYILNRMLFRLIRQIWQWSQIVVDGSYRNRILTKIWYGPHYHQQVTFTASNRYPRVFRACADYLAGAGNPRILSFGCPNGEELFSIGEYILAVHSDFSFTDTACAINYTPLPFEKNLVERNRPLFDRNNRKVAESQNNYRVFVRHVSLGK